MRAPKYFSNLTPQKQQEAAILFCIDEIKGKNLSDLEKSEIYQKYHRGRN